MGLYKAGCIREWSRGGGFGLHEPDLGDTADAQGAFINALGVPRSGELQVTGPAQEILGAACHALRGLPLADLKMAKIALLYALLRCGESVAAEDAHAAVGLLRHCVASERASGEVTHRQGLEDRIMRALAQAPKGLSATELSRRLRNAPRDRVSAACDGLLNAGRIARTEIPGNGRTTTVWSQR